MVVISNCLPLTRLSELGLYVSHWRETVTTKMAVISCFLLKTHSLQYFFTPTAALPTSLSIFVSHVMFCLLFLPSDLLSYSITLLIYRFILFLLHWSQLFICSIAFPLLRKCFDLFLYSPSRWKQEVDQTTYLFVIYVWKSLEFKASKDDN